MWENSCTCYRLTQQWVNLRVLGWGMPTDIQVFSFCLQEGTPVKGYWPCHYWQVMVKVKRDGFHPETVREDGSEQEDSGKLLPAVGWRAWQTVASSGMKGLANCCQQRDEGPGKLLPALGWRAWQPVASRGMKGLAWRAWQPVASRGMKGLANCCRQRMKGLANCCWQRDEGPGTLLLARVGGEGPK